MQRLAQSKYNSITEFFECCQTCGWWWHLSEPCRTQMKMVLEVGENSVKEYGFSEQRDNGRYKQWFAWQGEEWEYKAYYKEPRTSHSTLLLFNSCLLHVHSLFVFPSYLWEVKE